jgi:hypothetical protein
MRLFKASLLVSSLLLLGIATLAHVLMRPIEPNEQMYLTASVLAKSQRLYHDFSFLQMPYLPLLYAAIFQVIGGTYYLLIARWLTWLAVMTTLLAVGWSVWQSAARQRWLQAVLAAGILAMSESFILITGESSNYIYAMCFSVLAYISFDSKNFWIAGLLHGILLSLAIGFKLYYASFIPVFLVVAWRRNGKGEASTDDPPTRLKLIISMLLGYVVGLAPAMFYFSRDPSLFVFSNLSFHFETEQWYRSLQLDDRMTWFQKLRYSKSAFQHASQIWFIAGSLAAGIGIFRYGLALLNWPMVLAFGLTLAGLVSAWVPTPLWPQYLAMPVPFALIGFLWLLNRWGKGSQVFVVSLTFAIGLWVNGPYYLQTITKATRLSQWEPNRVHQQGAELLRREPWLREGEIVCLTPIVLHEANLSIDPAFASSRFVYQMADRLPESLVERLKTTSPTRLTSYLDVKKPRGIVTRITRWSVEGARPCEDDLDDYAASHGYESTDYLDLDLRVWRRKRS